MSKDLSEKVDILENNIYKLDKEILSILLFDHTTKENIKWATDNYINHGLDYSEGLPIKIELITGKNGSVIKPRIKKSSDEKKKRIKEKAEVFTPSWACNHQNNLVDEMWFDKRNVFNTEDKEVWHTSKEKITFPSDKSWQDYVLDIRLEITCGEAPYLVSRYDTTTGDIINPINRIGLLDRKIRIVNENTQNEEEWLNWTKWAYKSVYGFEWQGDSLLIARENLLYTFIDYYKERFEKDPSVSILKEIASIISWNLWQMDGLKGVVPNSCKITTNTLGLLVFDDEVEENCPGCAKHSYTDHIGKRCIIKDWQDGEKEIFFDEIVKGDLNG